mmetsp:Transcript_7755/g.11455  ORF Transcript_7755/g.11455 Transcript_7755/m.11455 type:complete len:922 (+) Transcript_7755:242-3007(+)|eukprot:CAMPEP_0196806092 /NCGR_PEP_ID=MMETSP1362-20130617/5943_1 /TAXON_ID=163516 /ORGANISM="Leptocylindrus danicus, Strain CCMP1856" /LENGTH=921 /DNA_ID=CAMNT_0042179395 /DNA_START=595 /DNA_END=3360 /DNA_ORIENTATION=-
MDEVSTTSNQINVNTAANDKVTTEQQQQQQILGQQESMLSNTDFEELPSTEDETALRGSYGGSDSLNVDVTTTSLTEVYDQADADHDLEEGVDAAMQMHAEQSSSLSEPMTTTNQELTTELPQPAMMMESENQNRKIVGPAVSKTDQQHLLLQDENDGDHQHDSQQNDDAEIAKQQAQQQPCVLHPLPENRISESQQAVSAASAYGDSGNDNAVKAPGMIPAAAMAHPLADGYAGHQLPAAATSMPAQFAHAHAHAQVHTQALIGTENLRVTRGQSVDLVMEKLNAYNHGNNNNSYVPDFPPLMVETVKQRESSSDDANSSISGLGSTNSDKDKQGANKSIIFCSEGVRMVSQFPPVITQGIGMQSISNMPLVLRSRSLAVATPVATANFENRDISSSQVSTPQQPAAINSNAPSGSELSNCYTNEVPENIPQAELVVDGQGAGRISKQVKYTISLVFVLLCASVMSVVGLLVNAGGSDDNNNSSISNPAETKFPSPAPTPEPTHVYTTKQRQGLEELYFATNGASWNSKLNWMSSTVSFCEWIGITCNDDGQVTEIVLEGNNMSGSLTTLQFESFPYLKKLCLADNALTSAIPSGIGALTSLQILDLSYTSFTSSIPTEIGLLEELEYLSFRNINKQGKISSMLPTEIGLLRLLEHVDIAYNEVTGTIPSEIGTLESIQFMDIGGNKLMQSTIPSELGNLSSLKILHAGLTKIDGSFPTEIGRLSNLEVLNFSLTSLTSTIPSEIGLLSELKALLLLWSVNISGQLPSEIGMLGNLEEVFLDGTRIMGSLPSEIGMMSKLSVASVSSCQLSSTIPSEVGNMQALKIWNLQSNNLYGPIPSEFGRLGLFKHLIVNSNDLTGTIPSEIGNIKTLQQLDVYDNQLTGSVPGVVCDLTNSTQGALSFLVVDCEMTCDCCETCVE